MKTFGPVEIHYGKVQQKVTLKYDSWHKEILSRFGGLLGENMHEFHGTVSKVQTLFLVCKVKQILSEYSSVSVNTLSALPFLPVHTVTLVIVIVACTCTATGSPPFWLNPKATVSGNFWTLWNSPCLLATIRLRL